MEKILNLIFGICSLLGLVATIVGIFRTLNQIHEISTQGQVYENLINLYSMLMGSIICLIIIILIQSFLFNRNISKLQKDLGSLPLENENLINIIDFYIGIYKSTTDSFHNITHYYRYVTILLREIVIDLKDNNKEIDDHRCRQICHHFEKYMLSLLSNVSSTCAKITQDECSSCIKLCRESELKTLYRDSISNRTREESDYTQRGQVFVYDRTENYAFELISNPDVKDTFFACDNLKDHGNYHNSNPNWNKLYNATIVVPIQANLSENKRKKEIHILGFLCCDNMSGGFENKEIKDFLSATGDLLYSLFLLYDRFYCLSRDKGLTNESLQQYGHWGSGGQV